MEGPHQPSGAPGQQVEIPEAPSPTDDPDPDPHDHGSPPTRGAWWTYAATAGAAAIVAAGATALTLWAMGFLNQEVTHTREVVEVREVIERPIPPATSAPISDTGTVESAEPGSSPGGESPDDTSHAVPSSRDLVAEVASRVIPSIVTVQSLETQLDPIGSGSGVVISSDGFIVTNHHVIEDADELKVITSEGLSYPAELVGSDPLMDIAVLEVDTVDLDPMEFGSLETLRVGDPAVAVGNPLGLDGGPSVTAGVISAFDRSLVTDFFEGDTLYGLLQTDAPITRGSSGGALADSRGRLLGVTTAIGLADVGAEGLGFAVPVSLLEGIVEDLMAEGQVRHAFLGISGRSAHRELEDGVELPLGVEIFQFPEGSAIAEAGAEEGDVIVALDGVPVKSMPLLVARLRGYRAGDELTVTVQRGDRTVEIDMILDEYPL